MSHYTHSCQFRVYTEDTDYIGVVYYANYLKFFERARTELLRENGLMLSTLSDENCFFVIAEAGLKYKQPARLDDLVTITTSVKNKTACSVLFEQTMKNEHNSELCKALITVVCINKNNRPQRLPERFNAL